MKYAQEDGEPAPPPPAPPDPDDLIARAFNLDGGPNALARLSRYQAALQRSVDRGLRQLKTYRAARLVSNPDPSPEDSPGPTPPVGPPVPPAEPAATPPESTNYHSNPTNEGIAQSAVSPQSAALPFLMYLICALLHATPRLWGAAARRLARRPRISRKHLQTKDVALATHLLSLAAYLRLATLYSFLIFRPDTPAKLLSEGPRAIWKGHARLTQCFDSIN